MANKKRNVVVFTTNNARVLVNPPNISEFESWPNAIVDPDLTKVARYQPHYWKRGKDKSVIPMTYPQRVIRDVAIKRDEFDNEIRCIGKRLNIFQRFWKFVTRR